MWLSRSIHSFLRGCVVTVGHTLSGIQDSDSASPASAPRTGAEGPERMGLGRATKQSRTMQSSGPGCCHPGGQLREALGFVVSISSVQAGT